MRPLKIIFAFGCFLIIFQTAAAQSILDCRWADQSKYRYCDFYHLFQNKVAFDAYYVGIPGINEFNVGFGREFKIGKFLTVVPLLYGTAARANGERGVKLTAAVFFEKNKWASWFYLTRFFPLKGELPKYWALDPLEVTRKISKFEVGVSTGFFHIDQQWNPLLGPVLYLNDKRGRWTISARWGTGDANEFRVGRVLYF